ncbi:MAG: enhanced serine sensitivity protein SseB C-terminal domain-containing protein [Solobacterium sp.]|jgi:hypothetical protein|nr:enhanced serine sensitivity protein SseB C-terminal domain-containing protein [Solobacterium sp.]
MSKKKKKGPTKKRVENKPDLSPVTNPSLKEAIAALKEGNTPEKQENLTKELKKARLLAPCDIDLDPAGKDKLQIKANQVRFFLITTNDGKSFFPAFTDAEESSKMSFGDKEARNIVRTIQDYDKMLQDPNNKAEGIVINPSTDNIVIPKPLLGVITGRIKQAPTPAPVQKKPTGLSAGAPVNAIYSEPAVYPTKMVNAVYDACETIPSISRVWLKQKTAGSMMAFYLPVECDENDPAILEKLREAAEPLAKEIPLEFVFYTKEIEEKIIQGAFALYDRELGI